MDNIISISHLSKSYGDVKAVDDISFDVERGSLFAFLGVNGAGKSTTINILCTLLTKDSGEVVINGNNLDTDAKAIKNDIGIVFQNGILDKNLSVKENLSIRASFYGIIGSRLKAKLDKLSSLLDLDDIMNREYGKLSGGQRRRVDIARALLNDPKIIFLDEPTTGLDPQTRQRIWQIVERLQRDEGTTVFLTTHYMDEADNASKVVIIDKGHIIACDTPVGLKNEYSGVYVKLYIPKSDDVEYRFGGHKYSYDVDHYKIMMMDTLEARDFVDNNKDIAIDFEIIKGNMDDVFLNATGKSLKEANDYE